MKNTFALIILSSLSLNLSAYAQNNEALKPFCESEAKALKEKRKNEMSAAIESNAKATQDLAIRKAVVKEVTDIVTSQVDSRLTAQLTKYVTEFPKLTRDLSEKKDSGLIAQIRDSLIGNLNDHDSFHYRFSQLQTNLTNSTLVYFARASTFHGEACTGQTGCWAAGSVSADFLDDSAQLKISLFPSFKGALVLDQTVETLSLIYSEKDGNLIMTVNDPAMQTYVANEKLTLADETTYLKQNLSKTCAKMFYPEDFTTKSKVNGFFKKVKTVFTK